MNDSDWKIRKIIIGALALGCWLLAGILYLRESEQALLFSSCIRCGALLTVLWFALPSAKRPAAWVNMSAKWWGTLVVGLILIAIRPKLAPFILVLLLILRFLWKPKQKKRPVV